MLLKRSFFILHVVYLYFLLLSAIVFFLFIKMEYPVHKSKHFDVSCFIIFKSLKATETACEINYMCDKETIIKSFVRREYLLLLLLLLIYLI